jgi:hypothetical protein
VLVHIGLQVIADRVRIPLHAGEKLLHPVRYGIADRLGELPAVLALNRRQQPMQVG